MMKSMPMEQPMPTLFTSMAALHPHLPERHGGEQRWHRLLHWHALHHAPPRLHLHHRHHLPRPLRVLDHLPLLSPDPNKGIHSLWTIRLWPIFASPPPLLPVHVDIDQEDFQTQFA